jgi:hypothetical protein
VVSGPHLSRVGAPTAALRTRPGSSSAANAPLRSPGYRQPFSLLLLPVSASPASYTPKHLAVRILAEREALEAHGSTDGERKTITALFADLKGSTALIEGLDPEEAWALIDPALHLMRDACIATRATWRKPWVMVSTPRDSGYQGVHARTIRLVQVGQWDRSHRGRVRTSIKTISEMKFRPFRKGRIPREKAKIHERPGSAYLFYR